MTCIVAIHFFYGGVIISRESLKCSICQRNRFYFTTFVAAIDYNKRSVDDLNLNGMFKYSYSQSMVNFLEEQSWTFAFARVNFQFAIVYTYFLRNSCSFGVLIVLIFFRGMQFWGTSTLQLHSLELVIWSR